MSATDLILPENPSLWTRFRVGIRALLAAKDDAANPQAGYMINRCFDLEVYQGLVERLKETEDGRRMLNERPSLQGDEVDLKALEALPEDTLGYRVAVYFRDNGIAPFATNQAITEADDYLTKRYRETHDFHHIITGYGTDVLGEMELQAFVRGNFGLRSPLFIVIFGYLASLGDPKNSVGSLRSYIRNMRAAYRRGVAAPLLLSVRFEDHWATPVEDLRRLLLIPAS